MRLAQSDRGNECGRILVAIASQGARKAARRQLGIGDEELVIGTAARLSIEKGLEHLVDAAPRVLQRHPDARFVVIGDGPHAV